MPKNLSKNKSPNATLRTSMYKLQKLLSLSNTKKEVDSSARRHTLKVHRKNILSKMNLHGVLTLWTVLSSLKVHVERNSHLTGTVNFTHLFPMFCVSIALIVGGKPVIGVIYAPFLHQLFSACKGRGAFLNETQKLPLINNPVPPMPEQAPKGCTFSCEWGKDRRDTADGNLHRKVDSFINMATEIGGRDGKGGMVHGVRCLGR